MHFIEIVFVLTQQGSEGAVEEIRLTFRCKKLQINLYLLVGQSLLLNESKFRGVIDNPVHNSIKFSMPGTTISIKTSVTEGTLILEVSDQGIGIKPENLEKIFDKFTSAKRVGTSGEYTTGLGLYITWQIISLHSGTISAYSDGKAGSTFRVRFALNRN